MPKQMKEERIPGFEYPSNVPRSFSYAPRPPSEIERIRALIRSERLAAEAAAAGAETWEEADDFDVGDDYDPTSPYEEMFEGAFDHLQQPPSHGSPEDASPTREAVDERSESVARDAPVAPAEGGQ